MPKFQVFVRAPVRKKKTIGTSQTNKKFAHIKGPAAQRPADPWITTAALHFIGVLFCCAACLEVSSALEKSPTPATARCAPTDNALPSLLVWFWLLIYDALSHHVYVFLFARIHLEVGLPTQDEMHRTQTCQRNEAW